MKASVQYNDLIGSAAADISDFTTRGNHLFELAAHFGIGQEYEPVGICISGVSKNYISFICVDKQKSNAQKEHIVKIGIPPSEINDLSSLFKRFKVVLYDRFRPNYENLEIDEEIDR